MNRSVKSATAQVTAKLGGGMELVSITNGMKMNKFYIEDAGGGFGFFPYNTITSYDQWSRGAASLGQSTTASAGRSAAYYLE